MALALARTATATEPLDDDAQARAWRTARTAELPYVLSTTVAIAQTASVARGRPVLDLLPRAARALSARLTYARGLAYLAGSRAAARSVRTGTDVGALVDGLDRAVQLRASAQSGFAQAVRLAAGAGPGLGHRVLILSLSAWAGLAERLGRGLAAQARHEAVRLAQASGHEKLGWSVRLEHALVTGGPVPDLTGVWPGFLRDDLPVLEQLLVRTASRSLALGDPAAAYSALERWLVLEAAAGPVVELDNRRSPDDGRYTRELRAQLETFDRARRALASEGPGSDRWGAAWAAVAAAREAVMSTLDEGELRLSSAAAPRVLGIAQAADTLRFDLGDAQGLLMPANVMGRLHLVFLDGAETSTPTVHVATDVSFERVQTDLDGLWRDLEAGRPPRAELKARVARAVFGPLESRLANKRTVTVVGGFLGRPIPAVVWPDGPVLTHVHAGSALAAAKTSLRVGGRGRLRVGGSPDAPLIGGTNGTALSVSEAVEFRTLPVIADLEGAQSLEARRPAEVLPDQVFDLLVAEAPLRLEPTAPERSALTLSKSDRLADAFRGELPVGRLAVPSSLLVLARTRLASPDELATALRLDGALAVTGYPSTLVVSDRVPPATVSAVLTQLSEAQNESPAAALHRIQRSLRAAMPSVDLMFVVGAPGMDAEARKAYAKSRLRRARSAAVAALSRQDYGLAIPRLERWIRLQVAAGPDRRTPGIYGALVGVLRDKVRPPRPARAADVQQELIELLKRQGADADRQADARIDLAHLLSRAHDFQAAEDQFSGALAVLQQSEGRRSRLARGWLYYGLHKLEQREYEAAAMQLEKAIKLYERLGTYKTKPKGDALRAMLQVGQLYLNQLADPMRARRAFRRVQRYAPDRSVFIAAEIDLARAARRRGGFIDAAAHAERARQEAVAGGYVDLELVAQIEAANVAWYQGDYRLGQELCQSTLRIADRLAADLRRKGPASKRLTARGLRRRRTFALSVCGLVAMSQRDFDGATGFLEQARRDAELLGDEREVATQLNNLGRVYLEFGRLQTAVETFRRAEAIDERLGDRYALAYDLRNLGRALALQGVRTEARSALERGLAYARQVRDANNDLRARFALAQLDLDEARTAEAVRGFSEALPLAERLQVKELEWQIHRYLGRVAWDAGRLTEAGVALQRAVRIAKTITGRSAPSEFGPDRFEAFEDLVRLRLAMGDPAAAFDVAEQARRLRQLELLSDGRIGLERAAVPLQALRTSTSAAAAERALAELTRTAPRIAALARLEDSASLVRRLPPDTAVVQYEITRDALVVFVLTAAGLDVRSVDMKAVDLRSAVSAYGRQLSARADLTVISRRIADRLVAPVLALLDGKRRVAFVLQGVLRYVAVPALPIDAKTQLIDRFEIVQALDARAAVEELAQPRGPLRAGAGLVALGAAPPAPGVADRPLPFATRELQVIKEEFPALRLIRGPAVTRQRVLAELARPNRVFHFAGHSYLAGTPEASRLSDVLGGQLRTADGGVTMLDVLRRPVNANLVVLSTCASLVGTTRPGAATGEDILSMAESLHLAGAGAVLGSTLNVDDVATALLMKRFYRAARREPIGAALRAAQLKARSLYGHPAWWASFALWVGLQS